MERELLVVVIMVILFFLNIPFYLFLGKRFFGSRRNMWKAIRISFSQSFFSLLIDQFHDDMWTGLKVGVYFVICILIVAFEYVCVRLWIMSKG